MQNRPTSKEFQTLYFPYDLSVETPFHPSGELVKHWPGVQAPAALHYHNCLEIGYCYAGAGHFIIDGVTVPFCAPCASIIYEGQLHIAQSNPETPSEWVFIMVRPELFLSELGPGCITQLHNMHTNFEITDSILYETDDKVLVDLIKWILQELESKQSNYLDICRGHLWALLARHNRHFNKRDAPTCLNHRKLLELIGPALGCISANYAKKITITHLASLCNFSQTNFRRLFVETMRLPPQDYINKFRIQIACSMLVNTKFSILDISLCVGFPSQSSFNRQFQKIMQDSPSGWKKRQLNEGVLYPVREHSHL